MKTVITCALAVLLSCTTAFSITRYIKPAAGGNDANSGATPATAWRTWAYAINHLSGGDILIVVNGNYTNAIPYLDPPLFPSFPANNPLIIRAQTLVGAKFNGGAGNGETLTMDGLSGYVWDGFEFRNAPSNVLHLQNCNNITIQNCKVHDALLGGDGDVVKVNQCHHIRFENSEFYNPSERGATPEFYQECFDIVDADDSVVKNCRIYHVGGRGTILAYCKGGTHRNIFEGCVFGPQSTAADQPAVLFGGSTDSNLFGPGEHFESYDFVMKNNIFYRCIWAAVGFYDARNSYLYNNLFLDCGGRVLHPVTGISQNGISQGILEIRAGNADSMLTRNAYIFNNIFLDTEGNMPAIMHNQGCHAVANVQSGRNLYWNAGRAIPVCGYYNPSTETGSLWQRDPLISVNAAGFTSYASVLANISIANNSPVWNAGANATTMPFPGVTKDIAGNNRNFGAATDIGPWELQQTAGTPPAPGLCTPNTVLFPSRDTYLDAWEPGQNFGADAALRMYGGYEGLHTGEGADRRTPALFFDVTSIPSNAIIDAATLVLKPHPNYGGESSNGCTVPETNGVIWIDPIKIAWTEGTGTQSNPTANGATWIKRTGTTNWTTAGGAADTTKTLLRFCTIFPSTDPRFYATEKFDITPIVQKWTNGTLTKQGFFMRVFNGGKYYYSRNAAGTANDPKLEICWHLPASTAARFDYFDKKMIEAGTSGDFEITPNPTSGSIVLFNQTGERFEGVEITDVSGRVVQQINQLDNGQAIDVASLQEGVYFLKSKGVTKRFVKI